MRHLFLTAAILAGVSATTVVRADDFQQHNAPDQNAYGAYMDQQATNSQLSDPTAANSIRSHGRP